STSRLGSYLASFTANCTMTMTESPFAPATARRHSANSDAVSVTGPAEGPVGFAAEGSVPPTMTGVALTVAGGVATPREAGAPGGSGSSPARASTAAAVTYRESVQNGFSAGEPAPTDDTMTKQRNGASRTCDALAENVRVDA